MACVRRWSLAGRLLAGVAGVALAGCSAGSAGQPAPTTVAETVTPSTAAVSGLPSTVVTVPPAFTTIPPTTSTIPPTSTTIPAPCNIIAVSDSVGIDLIDNGLRDRLADAGCDLKWTGGGRGIEIEAGAEILAGAADIDADIVLVMLGYHNANSNARRGRFPALIDMVLEAAGPRLVVWPMYGATDDCSANYKSGIVVANQSLQDATGRWPDLRLVDYTSLLAAHPEYSQKRCPHLLASGSKEVAGWLAGQLREVINSAAAAQ